MSKDKEEFNFNDFTLSEYESLLTLALERYKFGSYAEIENRDEFLLWRHDIDFSIDRALNLALIESEHGVMSTFFLHFHNNYYNLFHKETSAKVKKIISLGHEIGIHLDCNYYDIKTELQLEHNLKYESSLIKRIFNISPKVFSFHEPSSYVLKKFRKFKYSNFINTYSDFFDKNVAYCSDSNGYWRFSRLKDFLISNSNPKAQVLTHPVWWTEIVMSPLNRFESNLDIIRKHNLQEYFKGREKRNRKVV